MVHMPFWSKRIVHLCLSLNGLNSIETDFQRYFLSFGAFACGTDEPPAEADRAPKLNGFFGVQPTHGQLNNRDNPALLNGVSKWRHSGQEFVDE
jgi:hypothetical protein